ncbi:MAG: DUF4340 domain-containing protein [Tepidisphaeraceae bacterium]|jgi:uncharacterized protein DUF4340
MNFKTTIVLLIALIVVGVVFFYQQSRPTPQAVEPEQPSSAQGPKLFNVESGQVNGVTIIDSDGNRTVIQRDGAAWRMTEPVISAAVDWQTQDLIRTICDLRSQGRPDSAPADSGLDHPRYIVDLSITDGKSVRLAIGNNAGIGDVMYARANDGDVNLIDSSLAKNLKTAADDLRDKHLLPTTPAEYKQVRIITPTQNLEMVKDGDKWKILQPAEMPGDSESISSLISTITGTEATEFVKSGSDELAFARFDHPTMKVWLSTAAPSTQPTTQAPTGLTLTIGSPDSLAKDHYFAETSDGLVAKIAKSSLDSLQKTPLDLLDRDVFTVVPADVSKISLVKAIFPTPSAMEAKPSTTQATQPAPAVQRPTFTQLVVLTRRPAAPKVLGPSLPTSKPSTQPTTQPPQSVWEFAIPSEPKSQVDDSKVDALLAKFNPFRADKYLDKNPDSRAEQRYVVTLETTSLKKYHVEVVRPANGQTPYAIYNGLKFEIATSMLDALDADFHKTP